MPRMTIPKPFNVPSHHKLMEPGGTMDSLFVLLRQVFAEASAELRDHGKVSLQTIKKIQIIGREIRESQDLKKVKGAIEQYKRLMAEVLARKGSMEPDEMIGLVNEVTDRLTSE
jgi:hypothetical protein